MRLAIAALLWAAPMAGWNQEQEPNVNSRYTVESVELTGVRESKLSRDLRGDLQKHVGQKFDQHVFDDLRSRIRSELRPGSVIMKLKRGTQPETIRVVYEITRRQLEKLDTSRSKLAYHSKEGLTGDLTVETEGFILGLLSDSDETLERFAGFRLGYHQKKIFTDRLHFRFLFESFHEQWNPTTIQALSTNPDVPGIYRERDNIQPEFTVILARGLTLSPGLSFQRFQTQFPAARDESANAVTTTLRFRRRFKDSFANKHRLDAGYTLRAATKSLDSDFTYTRHLGNARYEFTKGDEALELRFQAGTLSGRAPLFERFSLGSTTTLRGWNKFDVAPLGGSRMAHGSIEYRHGATHDLALAFFYDSGAIWDRGDPAVAKHAAGIGLRSPHEGWYFYVGFPIRSGRVEPIFMSGVNF